MIIQIKGIIFFREREGAGVKWGQGRGIRKGEEQSHSLYLPLSYKSLSRCCCVLCSHSPDDGPHPPSPEPQRNVSIAAVRGAVRPFNFVKLCIPIIVTTFPEWLSGTEPLPHTPGAVRPSALCLYLIPPVLYVVFCVHMHSFAGLIRRTPPPTFSDTAITDRHSDTTIFQLRAHWVRIFWSIGSEKSFGHVPPVGVEPSTSCVQGCTLSTRPGSPLKKELRCCCVPIILTTFPRTSAERIHSRGTGRRASVQKESRCVCIPILVTTFPEWLSGTEPLPHTPGAVRPSSMCL